MERLTFDGNFCEIAQCRELPCPFCGGDVHFDKAYSYFRDSVIYCDGCDMVFTLDDCTESDDGIARAWNRRVSDG